MAGRSFRKAAFVFALANLVGVGIAELSHRSGAATRPDQFYFDLWHRVAGERFRPERTALVVIDEPTLAEYRDTPLVFWTPLFARAAAGLREAGAAAVGFDFLFSSSAENWISRLPLADPRSAQNYDIEFRSEIAGGKLVLAASRLGSEGGVDEFLLPAPDYLLAVPELAIARHVGLVDLISDDDGGVRHFQLAPPLRLPQDTKPSEAPRFAFPALVAARAARKDAEADERERLITYAGPPGTFPRVPLRALLAEGGARAPAVQALRGKAVIVGADFAGMNDVHFTPYAGGAFGRSGRLMAGAEVHANIVESLLAGRETAPLAAWARVAIFALLVASSVAAFQFVSPWAGLGVLAAAAAAAAAIGFALFGALTVFPSGALQLGLCAAYLSAYGARLTREERERAHVGRIFGRYVSPQVVAQLVASPNLPELGGAAREVTVLFSDIRGFTSLSEKLSAREVVEMLNEYFSRVCAAVLAEGGTIDKYIGDAIMVEFGAPLPQADHARRALRAALALRGEARRFHEWMGARFPGRALPVFDVGVGINTGEAVVGNIGSAQRMEYTAIGDAVNIASRLESATKQLGCAILASASTIDAAGSGVVTGKSDRILVKGREQPVAVFEVLAMEEENR